MHVLELFGRFELSLEIIPGVSVIFNQSVGFKDNYKNMLGQVFNHESLWFAVELCRSSTLEP